MTPSPSIVRMPVLLFLVVLHLLLGLCETAQASTAAPRLKLFTIFSMENVDHVNATTATTGSASSASSGNNSVVADGFDLAAIKAAKSDFILISHVNPSISSNNGEVDGYESTDSNQILYQIAHWKLIQEGSFYEVRSPYNVHIPTLSVRY